MKLLVFCSLLVFCAAQGDTDQQWKKFKSAQGYVFKAGQDMKFKATFKSNLQKINEHNRLASQEKSSYTLGVNEYSHLTSEEFQHMRGLKPITPEEIERMQELADNKTVFRATKVPEEKDWISAGAVSRVRAQGDICGACYTFATTGAIEAQYFIANRVLVKLSEQHLVDCSRDSGNDGCDGGLMTNAFEHVRKNNGISLGRLYPYTATDGACRYNESMRGASITGFKMVTPSKDEDALKAVVGTYGPVTVGIDSSVPDFQFYEDGIFYNKKCSSAGLDHAVLVVGYGTEDDEDYWLVKNSWGPTWGIGGFFKLARNRKNHCGIASCAAYPILDKSVKSVDLKQMLKN